MYQLQLHFVEFWLDSPVSQKLDDISEEDLQSTKIKHIRKALSKVFYLAAQNKNNFEGVIPRDANNLKITFMVEDGLSLRSTVKDKTYQKSTQQGKVFYYTYFQLLTQSKTILREKMQIIQLQQDFWWRYCKVWPILLQLGVGPQINMCSRQ